MLYYNKFIPPYPPLYVGVGGYESKPPFGGAHPPLRTKIYIYIFLLRKRGEARSFRIPGANSRLWRLFFLSPPPLPPPLKGGNKKIHRYKKSSVVRKSYGQAVI